MAPYRFPLFREIAKNRDIDLTVYFMSVSAKNRKWKRIPKDLGFKYEVLPKIELNFFGKDLFTYIVNYTFPYKFINKKFDVIISAGWLDFSSQMAFLLAKIFRKKFIIWSESTINEPSWRRTLSLQYVKLLVKNSDACLPIGTRAKEYLLKLGVNLKKIFVGYSTVDIELFKTKSKISKKVKEFMRKKYGIPDKKVILYVGQFIQRKGVIYLLEAFKNLKKKKTNIALILLGYGPEKNKFIKFVKQNKIKDVVFVDFVEVDEMPEYYGISDVFVLPSLEETWGLVINEAMAASLPVVTTRKVGSSVDLVKAGINGYVVNEANPKQLEKALFQILSNGRKMLKMGKASENIIRSFTPKHQAASFIKAVNYAYTNIK